MSKRLSLVVLVAALLVVALAGGVLVALRSELSDRRTGGPLACHGCGRSATAAPARVGEPVSMGPLTLRNESDATVTLERVALLDVDPERLPDGPRVADDVEDVVLDLKRDA